MSSEWCEGEETWGNLQSAEHSGSSVIRRPAQCVENVAVNHVVTGTENENLDTQIRVQQQVVWLCMEKQKVVERAGQEAGSVASVNL